MKPLFFDTETTGLPKFKESAAHADQPRVVQMAMTLLDDDGKTLCQFSSLIKPVGFTIDPDSEATEITGITQERADTYGLPMKTVLVIFRRMLSMADFTVAHSAKFDRFMMDIEHYHADLPVDVLIDTPSQCTMEMSKDIIKLPPTEKMLKWGMKDFKMPSLMEAHRYFFDREFDGAHDALADVTACKDIWYAIKEAA